MMNNPIVPAEGVMLYLLINSFCGFNCILPTLTATV